MIAFKTELILVTILLLIICTKSLAISPAYIRYVRRRPSYFENDNYMEEIVEEFDTINPPPPFEKITDDDLEEFFKNSKKNTNTNNLNVKLKTKPSCTDIKKTTNRKTTLRPNPYENKNPDYFELKPSITVSVLPPPKEGKKLHILTTTGVPIDGDDYNVEYYDNNDLDYDVTREHERTTKNHSSTTTERITTTTTKGFQWNLFGNPVTTTTLTPSKLNTTSLPSLTTPSPVTTSSTTDYDIEEFDEITEDYEDSAYANGDNIEEDIDDKDGDNIDDDILIDENQITQSSYIITSTKAPMKWNIFG